MRIRSIDLIHFRNIGGLSLEVKPSVNVFYGQNAQGKTNILEAVYLCACARSHRTSKDKELIMHGKTHYKVRLGLVSDRGEDYGESVSLLYYDENDPSLSSSKAKRIAEHNDIPVDKMSRYIGIFNAVIFAPEDMLLIKEGPSVRRRYLDLLISQIRPRYFYALQRYAKLLQQRNRTLKIIRSVRGAHALSNEEETELEIWDHSMSEIAAEIIGERLLFSDRIAVSAAAHHRRISSENETLFVRYRPVSGLREALSDLQEERRTEDRTNTSREEETKAVRIAIAKHLLVKLKASHQEDYERGLTSTGPHRDDLELSLDGEGLRPFASQGQQRSAALALKMAELDILREETRESPVLLLDDVFSELDAQRRAALISGLGDAQVFITCTEKSLISEELAPIFPKTLTGGDHFAFYRVSEGQAIPD